MPKATWATATAARTFKARRWPGANPALRARHQKTITAAKTVVAKIRWSNCTVVIFSKKLR